MLWFKKYLWFKPKNTRFFYWLFDKIEMIEVGISILIYLILLEMRMLCTSPRSPRNELREILPRVEAQFAKPLTFCSIMRPPVVDVGVGRILGGWREELVAVSNVAVSRATKQMVNFFT